MRYQAGLTPITKLIVEYVALVELRETGHQRRRLFVRFRSSQADLQCEIDFLIFFFTHYIRWAMPPCIILVCPPCRAKKRPGLTAPAFFESEVFSKLRSRFKLRAAMGHINTLLAHDTQNFLFTENGIFLITYIDEAIFTDIK